ncbi:5-(carboxyamino)imidazole ribonucleotide synthase [Saliniradius amylolyticus]|uniref:N5-carboxyaminoimidazole ribonucleotide synthase n=1 Tax=Saliniradius amylolyticus TaxID=2183582 RepID=A0A2S2DZQ3_9ALTE|nr:5-(carboxyamino)imidazole ribonucleotide synthase [Saliniradius amylolyticus]AWL10878.1 5-(carboxyamino)imidazole ribonucleotide synthase [Saliniradius amylolyticus]
MRVLILGSGQLARMMYLAGCPLGIEVSAVDVKNHQVVNPVTKAPTGQTLAQAAEEASAISAEFEHIPEDLLQQMEMTGKFYPGSQAILAGADRVREKQLLEKLGIANCEHRIVDDAEQLDEAVAALGDKLILKASRDGYDGYGQWRLTDRTDLSKLKKQLGSLDLTKVPLVVEKMLNFDREVSLVGVRGKDGQLAFYPIAENLHHDGQLHVSVAPAPNLTAELTEQAQHVFTKLAEELNYVGVLAVEFFQIGDKLLVNEIAPRVHNSGHWTMQGAENCQFENHVRAVCGLPIGDTRSFGASAMVNIIGYASFEQNMLSIPGVHLHWYGKDVRPKRKMGHFNVRGEDYVQLGQRMLALSEHLPETHFPHLASEARALIG